jgi:hypothetical protein
MGDPLNHAQSSARLFGGEPSDYLHIHTVMDSSKLFLADWRHRALLHNTFGIHVFEQLMGASFTRKSDGKEICTRTVISQHIMEDLGAIPTPGEFLREMPIKQWMAGITASAKKRMQSLTIDGQDNKEAYITSEIKWTISLVPPDCPGTYLGCKDEGSVTILVVYDGMLWDEDIAYWAELPIGPIHKNA